jgi:hypothetical protein
MLSVFVVELGEPRPSFAPRRSEEVAMALTDGDIAELAREVVDRRHPEREVTIIPADPLDPYRRGAAAWTVRVGSARSYVTASMTRDEARAKLTADLDAG